MPGGPWSPLSLSVALAVAVTACVACAGQPQLASQRAVDPLTGEVIGPAELPPDPRAGAVVYRKACASCHGLRGDGRGPAAEGLEPQPRDFTTGTFAYRSSASGQLPATGDLQRTVRHGLPGTAMPAWGELLTAREMADVIARIERFSHRFAEESRGASMAAPLPLPATAGSLQRGARVWKRLACGKCHGEQGRGDGTAADSEQLAADGTVMRPRDFTTGLMRGGAGHPAFLRTLVTGLDGTPMPSYRASASDVELADLANHVMALRQPGSWPGERLRWRPVPAEAASP